MIISYIKWFLITLITIILAILATIVSLISPKFATLTLVKIWGKLILLISFVKLEVRGLENIKDKPTIIMYNHKSFYDIFSFASFMNIDWRAMMKKELLKIPFFGQAVKVMGHYFVARDGSFADRREVIKILKKIKNGKAIFIAPEGTRNPDKKLLEFKDGGFFISTKTKVNIIPMSLKGADDIVKKNSLKINPGTIFINILPEIEVEDFLSSDQPVSRLKDHVYSIFNNNI